MKHCSNPNEMKWIHRKRWILFIFLVLFSFVNIVVILILKTVVLSRTKEETTRTTLLEECKVDFHFRIANRSASKNSFRYKAFKLNNQLKWTIQMNNWIMVLLSVFFFLFFVFCFFFFCFGIFGPFLSGHAILFFWNWKKSCVDKNWVCF